MPTMNVSLTEEMVEFVESEISSGDYVSASEVVRAALRVMRHEKELAETKLGLLRAEVDIGLGQAERGEFSDRSVDDIVSAVLNRRGA